MIIGGESECPELAGCSLITASYSGRRGTLGPREDGSGQAKGDDPRGGVRWIIPEKADYWTKP